MILGLYAAANGVQAVEDQMAVIANNIANVSTPGFRRQESIQEGFYEVFLGEMATKDRLSAAMNPGGGARMQGTFTDLAQGAMTPTGNPLHIGLSGPGFLEIETDQGVRYTRHGKLSVDREGNLVTDDGHLVRGSGGGAIDVSGGNVEIDDTGMVLVGGQARAQLSLVEFADPHALTRIGHTLYAASEIAEQQISPATQTRVIPATLELSNVQLPQEMIGMTMAMRAYAANQKVLTTTDETVGQLIQRVGMPS